MSFDIFPIVKKKGKATCAIGNCVYSYNGLKQQIVFGSEKEQNLQLLESDAKLYTIIQFSAMLLHIEMVEIFDLNRLCRMSHSVIKQAVDIFEVLEMMSKIRK